MLVSRILLTHDDMAGACRARTFSGKEDYKGTPMSFAFEYAPISKALVGADGRMLKVNKALAQLTGYQKRELAMMRFGDIIRPDSKGADFDPWAGISRSGNRVYQTEGRCRHRLGHDLRVLVNFSLAGKAARASKHLILQVLDITLRKRMEDSLRESEQRYRKLVEATTSYIYTVKVENNKPVATRHEQGCVVVTGYTSEEYGRDPDLWYQMVHQEDRRDVLKQANAILSGQPVSPIEHRIIHKDGSVQWVRNTPVPHVDEQGRLVSYDGLITCITEERKLKDQLHQAQKMEAIGQLAGGIAHDFNNILTTMIGYGTILEMKTSNDSELRPDIGHILSAAERAAKLTERLLAFSRKQAINPSPVNLNEVVQRVEKLLGRVIGEDIQLSYSFSDAVLTIMADSWQLEQVLINLATNARDAMPGGGLLTIETKAARLDEEFVKLHGYGSVGAYAMITVADSGAGMDEATQKRIFEPFFTTKEVGKGTGLGLAIVYGIVKQHRGYITVYSEPGKGTTFNIYLPVVEALVEAKNQPLPVSVGGKETVLLAEDDEYVRISTRALLEKYGYTVIEAMEGEDAIKKYREHKRKVDMVILDVIMPKKTGREVYEEIKKVNPDIKALFISGYTDAMVRQKGIVDPSINFISKPILPATFSKMIRHVLDASCASLPKKK